MEKSKQLLRSKIYKGTDKKVNDVISDCRTCQAVSQQRAPTPLLPSPLPESMATSFLRFFLDRYPPEKSY